jgi:hypothetical protein
MTLPNPLPTDSSALQTLVQMATDEQADACGGDPIATNKRARALYQPLFDAANKSISPKPDSWTPLSNMDAVTQMSQDTCKLYGNAAPDEADLVWKKCGNSFDPAKADVGFETLVDNAQNNRGLDRPRAMQDISTRFRSLATLRNSILSARTLGVSLPPVGDPGNPQWSRLSGLSVDFQKSFLAKL